MPLHRSMRLVPCVTTLCSGLVLSVAVLADPPLDPPIITSVHSDGTNITVQVRVPPGLRKITLLGSSLGPCRNAKPLAMKHLDGTGGTVTFNVPLGEDTCYFNVMAGASDELPAGFYSGPSTFLDEIFECYHDPSLDDLGSWLPLDWLSLGVGDVVAALFCISSLDSVNDLGGENSGGQGADAVVESDIWRIEGDRLYFFNQFRGLQIVDISRPERPELLGMLPVNAAGEDMYLLDSGHAVLLTGSCGYAPWDWIWQWFLDWSETYVDEGVIIVADVSGPAPRPAANVPVEGTIKASRLIANTLYVAAEIKHPHTPTSSHGVRISAYDLSDPAHPRHGSYLWFPGHDIEVAATPTHLLVSMRDPTDGTRSVVHIVDIMAGNATMWEPYTVTTRGRILDKFKMSIHGDVLTTVSEVSRGGRVTCLETFSLAGSDDPTLLGEIELAPGERLHATRFDEDRVYVVTFRETDPLWIVDLADPANPTILGELEVPGWSTYIEPLGDRLVAVGVEGSCVAVSLFDVSDVASPSLADKVLLGEWGSSSEANEDEKAFTVLPDAGLIMVPFQGYGYGPNRMRAVQLIDLSADSLELRGMIEHRVLPRRATLHRDHIVSLSAGEILVTDIADRDHPVLRGNMALSWSTERVIHYGRFLLQFEEGQAWESRVPVVHIAAHETPALELNAIQLENMPVVGVTVQSKRLFVAQSVRPEHAVSGQAEAGLLLNVFDLSALPSLPLLVQTSEAEAPGVQDLTPHWLRGGLLVWTGSSSSRYRWDYWIADLIRPLSGGGGEDRLIVFDVSDPGMPRLVDDHHLGSRNAGCLYGRAFASGDRLYRSRVQTRYHSGEGYHVRLRAFHVLEVIDFDVNGVPHINEPVPIPGLLRGVSHDGAVLYTTGRHWDAEGNAEWEHWLDALAYDGLAAHRIASHRLPNGWPCPVLVDGNHVVLNQYGQSGGYRLSAIALSEGGDFVEAGNFALPGRAHHLSVVNDLLIAQAERSVLVFDRNALPALNRLDEDGLSSCAPPYILSADGNRADGLWAALGPRGVAEIGLKREE